MKRNGFFQIHTVLKGGNKMKTNVSFILNSASLMGPGNYLVQMYY